MKKYFFNFFLTVITYYYSMISEIGGYSGLLIGFSVMDLASVIKYALDLANRVLNIP